MPKDIMGSFSESKMLELLKEINQVKEQIENCTDEQTIKVLKLQLNDLRMHYNILSEKRGSV